MGNIFTEESRREYTSTKIGGENMWKKGIMAGFANLMVGLGFNFFLGVIMPSLSQEYQNTSIFRPWTDPLMIIYFAYPFILGVTLFYLWEKVSKQFSGDPVNKAFQFAKLYFVIATIPGMFISYTSFQISLIMILSWTVVGFLQAYVSGFVFAKIK